MNLRSGDVEFLQETFPKSDYSAIIRKLVSEFVDAEKEKLKNV